MIDRFGFRSGRSMSVGIMEYLDRIYVSLSCKVVFVTLFLDFKRAFDTVNHQILLDISFHYGIRSVVFLWSNSYIQDRKQYVDMNGTKLSYAEINIGVPQGTVLGPLLLILYINDMHTSSKYMTLLHSYLVPIVMTLF